MSEIAQRIAENAAEVRGRIAEAAVRSGRSAGEVRLVAVTKYVSAEWTRLLFEAGCVDLGESRPQQLWEKADALADLPIRWHLIGHLQRNKIRRTLPLVAMIHSVDTPRLFAAIDSEAAAPVPILLEVNVSGDAAKNGFSFEEIESFLVALPPCRKASIRGLMCMAGLESDSDTARREFAALRELRDRLRAVAPPEIRFDELSMGMSGDYEIAIEEGATIVRVGSALFEGVATD